MVHRETHIWNVTSSSRSSFCSLSFFSSLFPSFYIRVVQTSHGLGFFKRIFSNVKIEQSSDKFGKKRRRHNWFMSSVRGWMNKKNFRFSTIFMERERDGSRNSGTRLSSIRNGKRYSRVCVLTQWQSNSVYVGQAWEEATSLPIVHP